MTLDEQYQKVIDDQRTYLMQLQTDFNAACEAAKVKAQEKIKTLGETADKEAKENILKEQKAELDAALGTLKSSVDHSTRDTMKKLEAIVHQKEELILADLEKQLANL